MPGAREWMGGLMLRAPAPLRSLRDVPGLGNLIHRLSHRVLPKEELVWAQVQSGPARGLWLELNPRTGQSYLRGEAEAAVQRTLVDRLRPGLTFYDLGANIGLFSLLGALLVGPSGKIVSFEPDPVVAARLRRNVKRNGFESVEIVEAGIWSSSGERRFAAAEAESPDRGVGHISNPDDASRGVSAGSSGTTIRCVALDDFVATGPRPDAIKCDIEGAEVEMLRGAEKLLSERRPWIVCETHSPESDEAVRAHLKQFAYECAIVDAHHLLAVPGAMD